MADKYVKLTCSWFDTSEWLQELSCGARLAWIQALVYCKTKGLKGVVKAPILRKFARDENIPLEDVEAMIQAAVADKAILVEDGSWIFTGWARYQSEDETNAERQKRFREQKKETPLHNAEPPVTESNALRNASNTEERRGEEKRGEEILTTTSPSAGEGKNPGGGEAKPWAGPSKAEVEAFFAKLDPKTYPHIEPEATWRRFFDRRSVQGWPLEWQILALNWARSERPKPREAPGRAVVGARVGPKTFAELAELRRMEPLEEAGT